jgi:hypothetical protein
MGKIRPQVLAGIICATVFALFAAWIGLKLEAVEVLTGVIGGLFGLLGGVSLRIIESEDSGSA